MNLFINVSWARNIQPFLLKATILASVFACGYVLGLLSRNSPGVLVSDYYAVPIWEYPYGGPIGYEFLGPSVTDRVIAEFVANKDALWDDSHFKIALTETNVTGTGVLAISELSNLWVIHIRFRNDINNFNWTVLRELRELSSLQLTVPIHLQVPVEDIVKENGNLSIILINGERVWTRAWGAPGATGGN